MLAGARVRALPDSATELVIANPSGGRGVYVLPWRGIRTLCRPTVHDTILFQRFASLPMIAPSQIRRAALAVAAEGYAGRSAASAATAASENDRSEWLLAHRRLLTRLLAQHDPDHPDPVEPSPEPTNAVLRHLSRSLGRPAAQLVIDLATIAEIFAPLGIDPEDQNARIPRMIARLDATSLALFHWLDTDIDHEIGGLGRAVAEAMQAATGIAEDVLKRSRTALSDPAALLARWIADSADVTAAASRCDWLLDGWERVCLLWAITSSDASRRAALLEMGPLVPILPREAQNWAAIPAQAMNETCRVTSSEDAWRGGSAAFGWIERNEQLRAMSI
jgi:hypothetical protein